VRREKKKITKYFLPLFVIFLFVGSMFGVMIGGISNDDGSVLKYGDAVFKKTSRGTYSFKLSGADYEIFGEPETAEQILSDFPDLFFSEFAGASKIYLNRVNEVDEVVENIDAFIYSLYTNLASSKSLVFSCFSEYKGVEECKNLPLKSCEDAGNGVLFFDFSKSEENSIVYGGGCFSVSGSDYYLTTVVDVIVLKHLGVLNG
tara:strand:+ start:615 stop:1223 length:609 start_codon:yes stop_codon:yes gene_type:complete